MAINIADTLIGKKSNKQVHNELVGSMQKLHKKTYLKAIDTFVKSNHYNILSSLDIPVLVLVGELDRLTPISMAKEISSKIDGSIFKIISNAGHLSNIENPNEFNKVVLAFLCNLVKNC